MIGTTSAAATGDWRRLADLPDDRLIERMRAHDALAFEALMRRHNRRTFRIARSVLNDAQAAEDAVQETFLSVFMNLDRYSEQGHFGAWLARIARNQALSMRRQLSRNPVSMEDAEHEADVATATAPHPLTVADRQVESIHARALLEHAVDSLPEALRMVFMLRQVEGMSGAETADCLELDPTTVRTRLHRAQKLMRAHLSERLEGVSPKAFDFDGERCDRIVAGVLARWISLPNPGPARSDPPTVA